MLDFNKQFGQDISEKSAAGAETTGAEWATRLQGFADQIRDDPSLAEHAANMADLADQTTELVPQARADLSAMPRQASTPPPTAREYSRLAKEFDDNLVVLDRACPR